MLKLPLFSLSTPCFVAALMAVSPSLMAGEVELEASVGKASAERAVVPDGGKQTDEVNMKDWPGIEADATTALQAAIDSGARRIRIPNLGKPYVIDPLLLRTSHQEIIMEEGVVIEAKPGPGFANKYASLLSMEGVQNVTIRGNGATLKMDRKHFPRKPHSEWRHGLRILGCQDVLVEGLTIKGTGGDGIYISYNSAGGGIVQSRNVTVRNVHCIGNHRQGISIISGEDLLIEKSIFETTKGTPPAAGVDLEPNNKNCVLKNIVVRDCEARQNSGSGFMVYLGEMQRSSAPVSVLFERCTVNGGGWGLIASAVGEGEEGVGGVVRFRDCQVKGTDRAGIYVYDKAAGGAEFIFENCRLEDVAKEEIRIAATPDEPTSVNSEARIPPPQAPISFYLRQRAELPQIHTFGGVQLIGCEVVDAKSRPLIGVGTARKDEQMKIEQVSGKIKAPGQEAFDASLL